VLTTDGLWRDLTCLTKLGPPKMASVRILSEIPELASAVRLLRWAAWASHTDAI